MSFGFRALSLEPTAHSLFFYKNMKVILIKTVSNLGVSGDIKEVSDGYARNFLIPQGLVKIANEATIKELEKVKAKKAKKEVNKSKQYKEIAKKIDNLKMIIKAKAEDKKKTLFAAIRAEDIAKELKKRGYNIESKFIKLEEPIKKLGYYDIGLDFGEDVTAKIGLTIERED